MSDNHQEARESEALEWFERYLTGVPTHSWMRPHFILVAKLARDALDTSRAVDEPTEAMIAAGVKHIGGGSTFDMDERHEMAAAIYKAVRAAQGERE